jgi:hypothetical protein
MSADRPRTPDGKFAGSALRQAIAARKAGRLVSTTTIAELGSPDANALLRLLAGGSAAQKANATANTLNTNRTPKEGNE